MTRPTETEAHLLMRVDMLENKVFEMKKMQSDMIAIITKLTK